MTEAPLGNPPANAISEDEFLRIYGNVYEHSAWIAQEAWRSGIHSAEVETVSPALREVIEKAGREAQLKLLRAHPDLAGRLAVRDALTPESASEQSDAGLDRCAPEEFSEFQELNSRYKEKFGFPFILAVRGRSREAILSAFRQRIQNDPATEFREALEQVHRIARLRMEEAAKIRR